MKKLLIQKKEQLRQLTLSIQKYVDIREGKDGVAARALDDTEVVERSNTLKQIDDLEKEIDDLEAEVRAKEITVTHRTRGGGRDTRTPEQRFADEFSVSRAVFQMQRSSKVEGIESEVHQEGAKIAKECGLPIEGRGILIPNWVGRGGSATFEGRASNTTTALAAGNLIPTEQLAVVDGYRPITVIDDLGCTRYNNIYGLKSIPVSDLNADAGFVGEATATTDKDPNIRRVSLVPKQIRAKIDASWLLLAEASPELDAILYNRLQNAAANTVNRCILKGGASNEPTGLIDDTGVTEAVNTGTDGRVLTYEDIIDMMTVISSNDAENFTNWAYVTTPGMRGYLMKKSIEAGTNAEKVWERSQPNMLNGFKALATTLMPGNLVKGASGAVCHGIVHGAFSEMHVANWGVRQLIYDPNTNDTGIRIKLIEFWDYVAANPKAFSKILGAKIA